MGRIIVLDELTARMVAAGEVVERPASVVKELVENSLDAGAGRIAVEISGGGVEMVRVTDDGCGIEADDATLLTERHATSKLKDGSGLPRVMTLGFRGEALASIAAVSDLEVISRAAGEELGFRAYSKAGGPAVITEAARGPGTSVTVRSLFRNTPARYKFLRKDAAEAGGVADIVAKLALSRHDVSFTLTVNGRQAFATPGRGGALPAIRALWGAGFHSGMIEVRGEGPDLGASLEGFVSGGGVTRPTRDYQLLFVNGRYVRSKAFAAALDGAFAETVTKGRHPAATIYLSIAPESLDVNVHPAKTEVKFADERGIYRLIRGAVRDGVLKVADRAVEADAGRLAGEALGDAGSAVDADNGGHAGSAGGPRAYGGYGARGDAVGPGSGGRPAPVGSVAEGEAAFARAPEAPTGHGQGRQAQGAYGPVGADGDESDGGGADGGGAAEAAWAALGYGDAERGPALGREAAEGADAARRALSSRVLGQAFGTYALLQGGDWLYLIDLHAAHERVVYERLLDAGADRRAPSQDLLVPVGLDVTLSQMEAMAAHAGLIGQMGYAVEPFGETSALVRAVPAGMAAEASVGALADLLCLLEGTPDSQAVTDGIRKKAAYAVACRASVKAGDDLSEAELGALLGDLSKVGNLFNCPHGRPVIVRVGRKEIERLFKRA
ncbi:MAG: DNA mismatch repair endonuclease MutL [Oscillospiraceae bacterium]|nr:DNA mismatch repair endonuclease MutL [Oscillospiraceae bacterium]